MKKRRIVKDKDSKIQFFQVAGMGLGLGFLALFLTLALSVTVPVLRAEMVKLLGYLIIFTTLATVIFAFAYASRESLPTYPTKSMRPRQRRIAQAIKKRLSDKILIDVLKLSSKTSFGQEMPSVAVYIDPTLTSGFIAIENQGRAEKLDRSLLAESISGVLSTKKLRRFSVTSSELSNDQVFYIFYIEDTATSQRLVVRNHDLKPFVSSNPHEIKLAKDLTWQVDGSTPFLAVVGRTRSGKSFFVAHYLLPLMELQGWKVEFHSIKGDLYVQKFGGESDPAKIIARLEFWVAVMKKRNQEITRAGKEKYSQMVGMPDVAVVIDEIGSLNSALATDKKLEKRWTSAVTQLTSTGASAGIHIIALAQYATIQGFLPGAARTNLSDSVIFLGMAADSASDRQFLVPGSEIPSRRYQVGQGLARIVTAGQRWEKLHFYETPYFEDD